MKWDFWAHFLFLLFTPPPFFLFFIYWEGSCIKGRASRWDMDMDLPTGVLGRNLFFFSLFLPNSRKRVSTDLGGTIGRVTKADEYDKGLTLGRHRS